MDQQSDADREGRRSGVASTLSPRGALLAGSGLLVLVLTALAVLLPVPYVLLGPGPTANTLGSVDGKDLISIAGRRTYPTAGHLDLTTVSVIGGPGNRLDLGRAIRGWWDPSVAVVPVERVYPQGDTERTIRQRNATEMAESQQNAAAAALRVLDIPVTEQLVVREVFDGSPASGILQAGDVLLAVDSTPVATLAELVTAIRARKPGEEVQLEVRRDGAERSLTVSSRADGAGRAVVGVRPGRSFVFPFTVEMSLEDVGGPSAGMMFALGIVDKLTPGQLNGGQYVAGTGTIDPDGAVGPIGGIPQKLIAARHEGAELFLVPAGNCAEAAAATPPGLRVVRIATLQQAVDALEDFRSGRAQSLPRCSP